MRTATRSAALLMMALSAFAASAQETSIQARIEAAHAAGGGVVDLGSKTWRVSSLVMKSNVTIRNGTIKPKGTMTGAYLNNVTLENVTFDCSDLQGRLATWSGVRNLRCINVRVEGSPDIAFDISDSNKVTFFDSHFQDCKGIGVLLKRTKYFRIMNTNFVNQGYPGGSQIKKSGAAVLVVAGTFGEIKGNFIDKCSDSAVYLRSVRHVTVDGNHLTQISKTALKAVDASSFVFFLGNTIDTTVNGISVWGNKVFPESIVIANNIIRGANATESELYFPKVRFSDEKAAIRVKNASAFIEGNQLIGNRCSAINVAQPRSVVIAENLITGNQGAGIKVTGAASAASVLVIEDNRVRGNKVGVEYLSGKPMKNLSVFGNLVIENGTDYRIIFRPELVGHFRSDNKGNSR